MKAGRPGEGEGRDETARRDESRVMKRLYERKVRK